MAKKGVLMAWPDRFWSKVNKTETCWLWTAARMPIGYGRIGVGMENRLAHVVSLELAGIEIPPGMVVDHICRTRHCVRPDHMRVVTRSWNAMHNNVSPSALNRAKTHCKYGHPLSGDNLARILARNYRRELRQQRTCLTCYPGVWNHPRRFWFPEDLPDVQVEAA